MNTPEEPSGLLAKVYTGIRDVAVYIGETSPGRRWWLGPWRPIEWAAIALIGLPTINYVDNKPAGTTLPVLLAGTALLTVVIAAMRLFLPKRRPSLFARAMFALRTLRPEHGFFDRPDKVVDNIVFTKSGVYAQYLFDGVSTALDSESSHLGAAQVTRNFGRYLPSGTTIFGLMVAEDTWSIMRNMVGSHDAESAWVHQCRQWESILDDPTHAYDIVHPLEMDPDEDLEQGSFDGPVRQRFWVSIPVDSGITGRTHLGVLKRLWDWVAGRDKDSDDSVRDYSAVARAIVLALPAKFNFRAATPAQILWYYRHRADFGVSHEPMPQIGDGVYVIDDVCFDKVEYDEADNHRQNRPWWRPSFAPLVRVGASYQTYLTVEHFPKQGIRFPRSSFLHALLRLDTAAHIEWMQHHIVRTLDEAQPINRRKKKNIRDQIIQRGSASETLNDLYDKLDGTNEYARELESTPAERELAHVTIIAVGADDPAVLDDAVTQIRQELDSAGIAIARRRGAQSALARSFFPGGDAQAPLDEFRNPTTAHRWSLFLPFISGWVGNVKGSPLAVDQTTAKPSIILHDPEGSARRNKLTGIAVVGEPGGGKSKRVKLSVLELIMRGSRAAIFEPDLIGEWFKALKPFAYLGIRFIDPTSSEWCFCPLRMYPGKEGRRMAAAHILPWIGLSANHLQAMRYSQLLRTEGVGESHGQLLAYLRAQPHADNDELLTRLEKAEEDFPSIFDDTLPVYRPDESAATVYLTGNLALPDADDVVNEHLYLQMETRQRTGMAVYGLLVDIEQQFMFSRLDRFDWMVFEEAAEMCSYPAGKRIIHTITKRGRKHATGVVLITQDFHDIAKVNDKFIKQKWILRITDRDLAYETLKWAGFDVTHRNDGLVTELCEHTSPGNTREYDDEHGEAGSVDPWRRGEGFVVDELDRRARCQFFGPPTLEQYEAFDTTALVEVA